MISACIIYASLVFMTTVFDVNAKNINPGEYFQVCRRKDPNLGECIKNSITAAKPLLTKGVPALQLPPLDPMYIPLVNMEDRNLLLQLINLTITGMKDLKIVQSKMDKDFHSFHFEISIPAIQFSSNYRVSGRILNFQLDGKGLSAFNFTDVYTVSDVIFKRVEINGKQYVQADKVTWTFKVGGAKVRIDNVFNNNKELNDNFNRFLNENWNEAFEAYKQFPEEAFAELFRQVMNNAFVHFPVETLLLDS